MVEYPKLKEWKLKMMVSKTGISFSNNLFSTSGVGTKKRSEGFCWGRYEEIESLKFLFV